MESNAFIGLATRINGLLAGSVLQRESSESLKSLLELHEVAERLLSSSFDASSKSHKDKIGGFDGLLKALLVPALLHLGNSDLKSREVGSSLALLVLKRNVPLDQRNVGLLVERCSLSLDSNSPVPRFQEKSEELVLSCLDIIRCVFCYDVAVTYLSEIQNARSIGHMIFVLLSIPLDEVEECKKPNKMILDMSLRALTNVLFAMKADLLASFLPGIISKLLRLYNSGAFYTTKLRIALYETLASTIISTFNVEDEINGSLIREIQSKSEKFTTLADFQSVLHEQGDKTNEIEEIQSTRVSRSMPDEASRVFTTKERDLDWLHDSKKMNDVLKAFFKPRLVEDSSYDLFLEKKIKISMDIIQVLVWYDRFFHRSIISIMDFLISSGRPVLDPILDLFTNQQVIRDVVRERFENLMFKVATHTFEVGTEEFRMILTLATGYMRIMSLSSDRQFIESMNDEIGLSFDRMLQMMELSGESGYPLIRSIHSGIDEIDVIPRWHSRDELSALSHRHRMYTTPFHRSGDFGNSLPLYEGPFRMDEFSETIFECLVDHISRREGANIGRYRMLRYMLGFCGAVGASLNMHVSLEHIELLNKRFFAIEGNTSNFAALFIAAIFHGSTSDLNVSNTCEELITLHGVPNPSEPWKYAEKVPKDVYESLIEFVKEIISDMENSEENTGRFVEELLVLAISARILGPLVNAQLPFVLFPVLEALGSSEESIVKSSFACLSSLSFYCGYEVIGDMLLHNVDYIIDAIGVRFRRITRYPHVLRILEAVLEHSGPRVLNFLGDVLDDMFLALDSNRLPSHTAHFFSILCSVVETARDSLKSERLRNELSKLISKSRYMNPGASGENSANDEVECGIDDDYNEEEAWRAVKEIRFIEAIMMKSVHYISYSSITLRMTILQILKIGTEALLPSKILLYPLLHHLWSGIVERLSDSEYSVVSATLSLLCFLAENCTSFLSHRYLSGILPVSSSVLRALVVRKKETWRDEDFRSGISSIEINPSLKLAWDFLSLYNVCFSVFHIEYSAHEESIDSIISSLSIVSSSFSILPVEFRTLCEDICAKLIRMQSEKDRKHIIDLCSERVTSSA